MTDARLAAYDALATPFKRCFQLIQAADRNLQLAKYGVQQLSRLDVANLPTALYPAVYTVCPGLWVDVQLSANYTNEKLRREIEEEIANDFPLLSGSAAIALWAALEDLVREFSTFWIFKGIIRLT